jgi:hypothetical protein
MKTKSTNIKTITTSEPPTYLGILIANIVYAELLQPRCRLVGSLKPSITVYGVGFQYKYFSLDYAWAVNC